MLCGILADIHGNLEAARAVRDFLHEKKVERIYVLGDVIGYGADPDECVRLVLELNAVPARGNHEEAAVTGIYADFSPDASACMAWTIKHLDAGIKATIAAWPDRIEEEGFFACHASPVHLLHGYIKNRSRAATVFRDTRFPLVFHAHTHFPLAFVLDPSKDAPPRIIATEPDGTMRILFEPGLRYLVNVGSVGQPRDGLPPACCGIFDTKTRMYSLHRVSYDWKETARKIEKAGLPPFIGQRLSKGV